MSKVVWDAKKIKKAAKDFGEWQGKAVIMCDTEDGSVWTDIFTNSEECNEYHSDTIHRVIGKGSMTNRNKHISAETLTKFLEAGIYKYDDPDEMPMDVLKMLMDYGF